MASIYMSRNESNLSEMYCQQAVSHAKVYDEEIELKTELLWKALTGFIDALKLFQEIMMVPLLTPRRLMIVLLSLTIQSTLKYRPLVVGWLNVSFI
jgi:hypothetical protein